MWLAYSMNQKEKNGETKRIKGKNYQKTKYSVLYPQLNQVSTT